MAREQPEVKSGGMIPLFLGTIFWVALLFYVAAKFSPAVATFVENNLWIVIGLVIAIPGFVFLPAVRKWFSNAQTRNKVSAIVFGLGVILIALVLSITVLENQYQVPAIRIIFLTATCLFPGSLYYLFVATRRYNLLNEYLTTLQRLGLFRWRSGESQADKRRRIRTHIESFEAVYGRLPSDLVEQLLHDLVTIDKQKAGSPRREFRLEWSTLISVETLFPVAGATVMITLGWILVLPPYGEDLGFAVKGLFGALAQDYPSPEAFAFLGAYFFSIQMLFRRYLRQDLSPNAYVSVGLRIILAVIAIWVAQQVFLSIYPPSEANLDRYYQNLAILGFVIGVFPQILWQLLAGWASKFPLIKKGLPNIERGLPLSNIDGISIWHETRLGEEDIDNIPNLAMANLPRLILQTRFEPARIIDWVDQAILYLHLGSDKPDSGGMTARRCLRDHGIYTASALIEAHAKARKNGDLKAFEAILPGPGRPRIRALIDAIKTNPNLASIQEWRGLDTAKKSS